MKHGLCWGRTKDGIKDGGSLFQCLSTVDTYNSPPAADPHGFSLQEWPSNPWGPQTHIQTHTHTTPHHHQHQTWWLARALMQVAGSLQCLLRADGWPDASLDLTLVPTEDWTAQSSSLHTLSSCAAPPLLTGASIRFDGLCEFFFFFFFLSSIEPYGAIIKAFVLGAVILHQRGCI